MAILPWLVCEASSPEKYAAIAKKWMEFGTDE